MKEISEEEKLRRKNQFLRHLRFLKYILKPSKYLERHPVFPLEQLAQEYAYSGLEQEIIERLLLLEDNCTPEMSKEFAKKATDNLPYGYLIFDPPNSFNDIKQEVLHNLKIVEMELFENYFKNFAQNKIHLIERIKKAREEDNEKLFEEIIKELEPLIEGTVTTNLIVSGQKEEFPIDLQEELERKCFAIWPVAAIQKHAKKERGNRKLLRQAQLKLQKQENNFDINFYY